MPADSPEEVIEPRNLLTSPFVRSFTSPADWHSSAPLHLPINPHQPHTCLRISRPIPSSSAFCSPEDCYDAMELLLVAYL